ncbi:gliding motility lipoprotein GldB [Leptobacterium sp. I13]|uniref:gliding motility lipoprotein GldB n=1 Tax=Leptobacterium meishanense TaxID=3128904 RepID=UPI0030EEBAAC
MKNFTSILFLLLVIVSCNNKKKIEKEIAKIQVEVIVDRFDRAFAKASPDDLPGLKNKYPYLFPEQFPDSVWTGRMQDSLQKVLFEEVNSKFSDFEKEKAALEAFFKHVKYYFPEEAVPKVVTVTSDVDYNNSVIYTDSLLLIALDNYLGEDHRFYEGIQKYLRKNLKKEQLIVGVAEAFAEKQLPYLTERDFLSQITYYGKQLYIKSILLPKKSNAEIMGYTPEEWDWAMANEREIWQYFVEQSLLFSTDRKLQPRFINPAPFSKFYLELDNESPGQLGRFIGWQIVTAYMGNNDVSLQKMITTPGRAIFENSQYKPKK